MNWQKIIFAATLLCVSALAQAGGACSSPAKPLPSFRSGSVAVAGGSIYYEAQGTGPALVLIHGGYNDLRLWDGEFDSLAQQHTVVRFDVRGFGKSTADGSRFAPVSDLLALLDALKLQKPSILGLSLGAMIATDFALAYPGRVDRLVLVSPGLRGAPPPKVVSARTAPEKVAECADRECTMGLILSGAMYRSGMKDACYAERARRMLDENWKNLRNLGRMDWPTPPAAQRVSQIAAPTLVVVGDKDDPAILDNGDLLASGIPNAKKLLFPGVSHHLNMEIPQKFSETVLGFLSK